jgi:hypothetical protein
MSHQGLNRSAKQVEQVVNQPTVSLLEMSGSNVGIQFCALRNAPFLPDGTPLFEPSYTRAVWFRAGILNLANRGFAQLPKYRHNLQLERGQLDFLGASASTPIGYLLMMRVNLLLN